jgi:PadR family transcriptional regulator PadR
MVDSLRMSDVTLRVLSVFVNDPSSNWYGLELCQEAGLKSGTIYPMLARLESAGILESHFETGESSQLGRPRRRLYRLTPIGAVAARQAIEERVASLKHVPSRRRTGFKPEASPT